MGSPFLVDEFVVKVGGERQVAGAELFALIVTGEEPRRTENATVG